MTTKRAVCVSWNDRNEPPFAGVARAVKKVGPKATIYVYGRALWSDFALLVIATSRNGAIRAIQEDMAPLFEGTVAPSDEEISAELEVL